MDADDRLTTALADDLDGAFEALVVAHQDRLYTIAARMLGDAGDAEEAAQDALVRAYRALASYDGDRIRELRLRPWLTTIVLNRCRSVGARRATRGPRPISIDGDGTRPPDPEAPAATAPAEIAERHASLSTPPDGRFATVLVVQRRMPEHVDVVRGCLSHRITPGGQTEVELTSYDVWRSAIEDGCGLSLAGIGDAELRALFGRQLAAHHTYMETR